MEIKEKIKNLYQKEHVENNLTYRQIQEKYNIPRGTWSYYIKKLELNYDGRKYRCVDNYFDSIDNYKKAYILGFLYADGCITNDGRVSILLNSKDVEILEFIKSEICPNSPIVYSNYQNIKRNTQVKLRFLSKNIYKKLKEYGFVLNKTNIDSSIFLNIPDEFKIDFIRGYMDGDGNVRCQLRESHKKDGKYYWTTSFSFCNGSIKILQNIRDYLFKKGISNSIMKSYQNKSIYYTLTYNKKIDTYNYCKLIYSDLNKFSLQRKQKLALKVIELCNNTEVTKEIKKSLVP